MNMEKNGSTIHFIENLDPTKERVNLDKPRAVLQNAAENNEPMKFMGFADDPRTELYALVSLLTEEWWKYLATQLNEDHMLPGVSAPLAPEAKFQERMLTLFERIENFLFLIISQFCKNIYSLPATDPMVRIFMRSELLLAAISRTGGVAKELQVVKEGLMVMRKFLTVIPEAYKRQFGRDVTSSEFHSIIFNPSFSRLIFSFARLFEREAMYLLMSLDDQGRGGEFFTPDAFFLQERHPISLLKLMRNTEKS